MLRWPRGANEPGVEFQPRFGSGRENLQLACSLGDIDLKCADGRETRRRRTRSTPLDLFHEKIGDEMLCFGERDIERERKLKYSALISILYFVLLVLSSLFLMFLFFKSLIFSC